MKKRMQHPVHPTQGPDLNAIINGIITYMVMAKRASATIQKEKRGTTQLAFQMEVEANLCHKILSELMELAPDALTAAMVRIQQHPDFPKELQTFVDEIAPPQNLILLPGQTKPGTLLVPKW